MKSTDKKFKELRDTFFLCAVLFGLFYFFNQAHATPKKITQPVSSTELVLSASMGSVAENTFLKDFRVTPIYLSKVNVSNFVKEDIRYTLIRTNNFDIVIKPLLKNTLYLQHFAGGLDDFPLSA